METLYGILAAIMCAMALYIGYLVGDKHGYEQGIEDFLKRFCEVEKYQNRTDT